MTRLTATEILEGVRHHLEQTLYPELQTEPARVAAQMMGDLIETVQRRIALAPQWLVDETDHMLALLAEAGGILAGERSEAAVAARRAIATAEATERPAGPDGFALDGLERRYGEVTAALDAVIRALGFMEDDAAPAPLVRRIQEYLVVRSEREVQIAGDRPMRGRG